MRSARLLALMLLPILIGCVKPKGDEYKTSELSAVYARTVSGGLVLCDAYYYLKADSTQTPVNLEDTALVTCNGTILTRTGTFFSGSTTYIPANPVAISLIRRVDGSTVTDTEIVY